jgi:hypothetical protein
MAVVVRSRAGSVGHKVVPGLIALAAASVTCLAVTACGSTGSGAGGATTAGGAHGPAPATTAADPLAGLTGDQVVAKAVAELKAVPGFTMAGTVTDSSGTYNVNLSYKKGSGCQGTVAQPGKGSFAMVVIGTTAWVKPDDAFWKANAGRQADAAIALLAGRYLKGSTSNANVASLTNLCDVNSLARSLTEATGVVKGPVTVMGGQRVLPLTDKAKGGTLYVTDASPPRILQLSNSKAGDSGKLTFSYTPVTLTPPPASQAVDGSKLGF